MKSTIRMLTAVIVLALATAPVLAQHTTVPASQIAAPRRVPLVRAVGAINMTVSDLSKSVKFYTEVLAFTKTAEHGLTVSDGTATLQARTAELQLGNERITLTQCPKTGQSVPADSHSNDLWFQHIAIIVSDMDRAYAVLHANHVANISPSPQRLPDWNRNAAGIQAFYFKDPDGHPLEILYYPAGKGDPKWHRPTNKLFLGIDHTAIAVNNTNASLAFYRGLLGMHIAGESENYGPEQERLNNVPGAHLRITSLRADSGPGIELLEYLSPHTGRRLPQLPAFNDLVHRQTELEGDVAGVRRAVLAGRQEAYFVPASLNSQRATAILHDPDGHELVVHGK